ncbi:hypothetical protein LJR230_000928 [Trinickia sp. LjRoot230]|uniref:hypothetical protein n=1 Tax=Trinickia sp. LjRoot230 TaxID=3342288 RepID=UPI003ECD6159
MGSVGDLASKLRPSTITYSRRLNQVSTERWGPARGEELTRLAVLLDKLPRPKRLPAFNDILDKIIGDIHRDQFGIRAYSGLPFEVRPIPLAALAFRIGSLPDPATRVSAFNDVTEGYRQLTEFVSQNRNRKIGTSLNPQHLAMLRETLASAVDHLPEDARPSALESLDAIH